LNIRSIGASITNNRRIRPNRNLPGGGARFLIKRIKIPEVSLIELDSDGIHDAAPRPSATIAEGPKYKFAGFDLQPTGSSNVR
jgi:hypothetical protein